MDDDPDKFEVEFKARVFHYPDGAINELCAAFSIEGDLKVHVDHWLEATADTYLSQKENPALEIERADIIASLSNVGSAAQKLIKRIKELEAEAHITLSQEMGFHPSPVYLDPLEMKYFKFGDTLAEHDKSGLEYAIDDLDKLLEGVERAKEEIPPSQRGRKEDIALSCWTHNFVQLWEQTLGRKMTLDLQAGEAATESTDFASRALKLIDPTVPDKSLVNHLRKSLKIQRSYLS